MREVVKRSLCAVGIAGALGAAKLAAQDDVLGGPHERLVIRGATVIDGTGGPAVGPMDIVVENDRIVSVSRATALDLADGASRASGSRVIDGSGMYVMPGLIDAHTHMSTVLPDEYIPNLWLAHGVTTVRVFVGSDEDQAIRIAEVIDARERLRRVAEMVAAARSSADDGIEN